MFLAIGDWRNPSSCASWAVAGSHNLEVEKGWIQSNMHQYVCIYNIYIYICVCVCACVCVCVCLNHDYESVQSLESKQEKQCHCTGLGRPHNVPPHEPSQCHPRRQSRCMDNFANRKPVSWGILKGRFESTTAQPHMATTYSGIFFVLQALSSICFIYCATWQFSADLWCLAACHPSTKGKAVNKTSWDHVKLQFPEAPPNYRMGRLCSNGDVLRLLTFQSTASKVIWTQCSTTNATNGQFIMCSSILWRLYSRLHVSVWFVLTMCDLLV